MAYGGLSRDPFAATTYRQPTIPTAPAAGGMNAAALAAIQKAKAYYQPGGGYGKGVEAGLERGRVKAMASGMQGLVSAGLAGTTMAGGLGKKYEEEIAAPTRLGVEGQRAQALAGLEMGEAGMQFQATESAAQRSLQLYMAQLQAGLGRGGRTITGSVGESIPAYSYGAHRTPSIERGSPGSGYYGNFPSIYNSGGTEAAPNLM